MTDARSTAIIFTSGTTGTPKGVMMTEAALLANARRSPAISSLSDDDRTLAFLPLYYTYTLSQVLSTWAPGGSVVLMRNLFYPRLAFEAIAEHACHGIRRRAGEPEHPRQPGGGRGA